MGFSTTAAHAIFFVAAIVIAAGVAGVVNEVSLGLEESIQEKSELKSESMTTDIEVVHVYPGPSNTSIYIINAGDTVLAKGELIVFLDEQKAEIRGARILNRSTNIHNSLWDPSEILEANISQVTEGRHKVKALVRMNTKDEYYFNM